MKCVVTKTVMPRVGELADHLPEVAPRRRIDARGRLVEEEDRRLVQHGAAERQALAPAAGERRRCCMSPRPSRPAISQRPGDRAPRGARRARRRCRRRSAGSRRPSGPRRARTSATCSRCWLFTRSVSRRDVEAADHARARRSGAGCRTASGWWSTCRRRSVRESRRRCRPRRAGRCDRRRRSRRRRASGPSTSTAQRRRSSARRAPSACRGAGDVGEEDVLERRLAIRQSSTATPARADACDGRLGRRARRAAR